MRDIAEGLRAWHAAGTRFALATVVRTWRSAPRRPGAAMAVAETGEVLGSVSGGCVEAAVYEVARAVLASGEAVLTTYGVSDGDALEAGLTCGGVIDVLVRPVGGGHFPELPAVLGHLAAGRPVAVASVVSEDGPPGGNLVVTAGATTETATAAPPESAGTLGDARLDAVLADRARALLAQGRTGVVRVGRHGEQRQDQLAVFVQAFARPPRMLVFGAIDFASAVARMGKFLGYHVTVCDARPVFATRERFPEVDELVVQWPHRYLDEHTVDEETVICVLTHDPKFDVPLLARALRTPARYIGAMGSHRTHEDRLLRLREVGVEEGALARLASPIGLDLGARTPEETAVAIMAEIIALRWGGTGDRLSGARRPIHPRTPAAG
ncbi:XdhC family protein [Streptomyces liangshanensis]|uniref:XdhC family protein n=1 Tax=Streptomyces liangshanensis TaxID=2717324 RepID=UPI0036DCCF07